MQCKLHRQLNFCSSHVKKIKENIDIFTILEGKIWEKDEVTHAFNCGADSVVIGSAVTRPQLIVKRFMGAIKNE